MSLVDIETVALTETLRTPNYRAMWGAAVLQAKSDVEQQPYGSIDYDLAVAFFIGDGVWAESRLALADCLELHLDDLENIGRRCIAERRNLEGLPPDAGLPLQQASLPPMVEPYEPIRSITASAGPARESDW